SQEEVPPPHPEHKTWREAMAPPRESPRRRREGQRHQRPAIDRLSNGAAGIALGRAGHPLLHVGRVHHPETANVVQRLLLARGKEASPNPGKDALAWQRTRRNLSPSGTGFVCDTGHGMLLCSETPDAVDCGVILQCNIRLRGLL